MPRADDDDDRPSVAQALRFVAFFVVPLVLGAAAFVHWFERPPATLPSLVWPDEARREVEGVVESRYVDPLTQDRAERHFDAAMKGYVEDLDPFSRYFTAKERTALDEEMSGTFGGIGVRVDAVPSGLAIVAVRRDGPADRAGVVPGETIEAVDGVPLTGRERDAMVEMIKGAPGTRVSLALRIAAGGDLRHVEATRGKVESDSVPAVRTIAGAPRIGYLRLSQFSETTPSESRDALRSLVNDGAAAIVLDLRHNLGGVVQAAVDVASLFLPPDTLVCTARARDGAREYFTAVKDGFDPLTLPLVVLVDESSASASEILAGALQDHGRALVAGDRTYGKFLMQTLVPLAHRGALVRLTTARYVTPRGRSDQRGAARSLTAGLMPDVRVPLRSREESDALAIQFAREAGPAWKTFASRDSSPVAPDRQLATALELLRGAVAPAEPVSPRVN